MDVELRQIVAGIFDEGREHAHGAGKGGAPTVVLLERAQELVAPRLAVVDDDGPDRLRPGGAADRAADPGRLALDGDADPVAPAAHPAAALGIGDIVEENEAIGLPDLVEI